MALGRAVLLPSTVVLLLSYCNIILLSGFLGENDALSDDGVRLMKESSVLQVDGLITHGNAGGSSEDMPSAILSQLPLTFDPPDLDFREQSIGMPRLEEVHLLNPSKTQPLQLTSISGDSPDFHPSFFKSKVVKPGEWTSFDVVFLARVLGPVHNTLYIHTSLGTFDYKVQGVGTENPFRLRSLLGARIPLNVTYSPVISMYNPFPTALQVTEMYSSGGELHIELLSGQPQGSRSLWVIRPGETKTIARVNFFGRVASNHTLFIRIQTSHPSHPSLVLPVEVEVSPDRGLFLSRELLDFALVKSGESKSLPLYVRNSGPSQVHIRSITLQPENAAIDIDYMTTLLKPGSKYTKIAVITLYADRVEREEDGSGVIVIRAEDRLQHQLELPYVASVLKGSLSYEKTRALFRVGQPPFDPVTQVIPLSNQFNQPIMLYDAKLPSKAQEYFTVERLKEHYILPVSPEWHNPLVVTFTPTSSDCLFSTSLRLSTNATLFNIPLHCFDGRVKYSLENPDEDVLDYGVVSDTDTSSKLFFLHNPNPVKIQVTDYRVSVTLPYALVELIAIIPSNSSSSSAPPSGTTLAETLPYTVEPGHKAVFRVNVTRPKELGTFQGEILVRTSYDRELHVPVYYKTLIGGLSVYPEIIEFEPSFPFATSEVVLSISNQYQQPVNVRSIKPHPTDSRFYISRAVRATENGEDSHYPQLGPSERTEIGSVVFDPLLGDSVYLGVSAGSWGARSPGAASGSNGGGGGGGEGRACDPSHDVRDFKTLWGMWQNVLEQGLNLFNMSLLLSFDLGSEVRVPARGSLVWPSLLRPLSPTPASRTIFNFPTTSIGNSSAHTFEVANPTNWPLAVQPLLLHHYSRPNAILDLLSDHSESQQLYNTDFGLSSSFSLLPSPSEAPGSSSKRHDSIQTTVLPAHTVDDLYQITVAFTPKVEQMSSSLLLIRNNLTVLEYVLLQGLGVQGVFTVDGIQPGSEPLLFEFPTNLLQKCEVGSMFDPIKVSKVFRMRNSGPSPLTLSAVGVGGRGGCEDLGFTITGCDKEITIKPNKTKKIEISFTPDFTISRISNTLRVRTSTGLEMLFPLLVLIPHNMLATCYAMQPKPAWEKRLVWLSVPFWLCVLLLVIVVVVFQTNCGVRPSVSYHSDGDLPAVQPTGGKLFNFRDITRNVQATITRSILDLKTQASHRPETLRPVQSKTQENSQPRSQKPTSKPPDHQHPHPSTSSSISSSSAKSSSFETPPDSLRHRTQTTTSSHSSTSDSRNNKPPDPSGASSSIKSQSSRSPSTGSKSFPSNGNRPPPLRNVNSNAASAAKVVSQSDQHTSATLSTDSRTGMREIQQSALSMKSDDSFAATSQPSLVSKSFDSSISNPVLSSSSASDTSAPNTGTTSTPQTSRKKSRRSSGKNQKSPPSVTPIEPPPPLPPAAPILAPPPQPPPPQLPVLAAAKLDQLERKESEDSIKSTDSESASISSSSDKSEEKDEPERPNVLIPIEIRKPPPPLAKEPNTGQTMLLGDTPEDVEGAKNEMDSPPEPSVAVLSPRKDERDRELVSSKVKGKKKQRQQLKKEEKLRRKEKEKAKEREREREKGKQQREKEKKQVEEHEQYIDLMEPNDKELSASNSSEQVDDEILEPLIGDTQETVLTGSPIDEGSPTVPEFEDPAIVELKVEMSEAPISPSMIMTQVDEKPPRKQDLIAKLSAVERNAQEAEESESPCPSPPQPLSTKIPVIVSDAVPSSAIKTSRGGMRNTPKTSKDEGSDPFSRIPDRSTYASKKPATKKVSIPDSHLEITPPQVPEVPSLSKDGGEMETTSKPKQRQYPQEIENAMDGTEESILPDTLSEDMTQEGMLMDVPRLPQHHRTSPHELAASLLSHNPAIKRRKLKTDKPDDTSVEEGEIKMEADAEKTSNEVELAEAEISPKKRSTGEMHLPQKSHSHPGHSRMPKPPTTLSLDAQPFIPHLDVKPKNPPPSHHHHHPSHRGKYGDHRKYPSPEYGAPPGLHHPMNMVPPGFTPEEAGMAFTGQYPEKQHYRKNLQHPLPVSKLTPSPPPYNSSVPDSQHLPFHDAPLEPSPQEPFGYEQPGFESVDDAHLYALSGGMEGNAARFGGRSRDHIDPALLASLARDQRRHMPPSDAYLRLQQQRIAAAYRRARERNSGAFSMSAGGWDQPESYHSGLTPEEEELIHRQRMLKKQNYMKALARKSAEALSSLNYPPYRGEGRSPMLQSDLISPASSNLWDAMDPMDVLAEDSFLSESVHAHQLRQQQLMQEQSLPAVRHPPRRRTLSSDSEIGGEYISDLQSTLHGPSSTLAPPGLNRAPGTVRMDPQRVGGGGGGGGGSSGHSTLLRRPGWPADNESSSSNWGSSGIWSSSLETPFSSSGQEPSPLAPHRDNPSSTLPAASTRGSGGGGGTAANTSQPYVSSSSNTYDLFENQSIWSLSNQDSSNLLSWAQLKPDPPNTREDNM